MYNYSLMKSRALLLWIWIMLVGLPVKADICVSNSYRLDKRIKNLSHEGQDLILMAGLIAYALKSHTTSTQSLHPLELNPYHIFLAATTKVVDENKGIFHQFSLVDRVLFSLLKQLNILKSFQNFLLEQLGFNNDYSDFFSKNPDGSLTLYLNESPALSSITAFTYQTATNILLDEIGKSKQGEINYIQNIQQQKPSFFISTEHFLLATLDFDHPIRTFLFNIFNVRHALEIRSSLYPIIDDVRKSIKRSPKRLQLLSRDQLLQEAISLIKGGISVVESARMLNISNDTLQKYLQEYEAVHGPISRLRLDINFAEIEDSTILQQAIPLIENGGNILGVARQLNISRGRLRKLIREHEKINGPIRRPTRRYHYHSSEEKTNILQQAIPLIEEGMDMANVARRFRVKRRTFHTWIQQHERRHGPINREKMHKQYSHSIYTPPEEKNNIIQQAILLLKENRNLAAVARRLNIPEGTLRNWLEDYEAIHAPINSPPIKSSRINR